MIDTKNIRTTVVKGLREYLNCPVIRSNQNGKKPAYPYVAYTITTLATHNRGTWGVYTDGKARIPVNQIWSITAYSDDEDEAVTIANKIREWFDYAGMVYLNDNDVIVQTLGNVASRTNLLTVDYQYSYGLDCTFRAFDVVDVADNGEIKTIKLEQITTTPVTTDELTDMLGKRLDGDTYVET